MDHIRLDDPFARHLKTLFDRLISVRRFDALLSQSPLPAVGEVLASPWRTTFAEACGRAPFRSATDFGGESDGNET
jgi:hypothetical protein